MPAQIAEIMAFPVELVKKLISNGYLQEHADEDYYKAAPVLLKTEIDKTLAKLPTVKDLARESGLSERTMQKRLKAGELPGFKFNGKYFIYNDEVLENDEEIKPEASGVYLLSYFEKYGKTRQGLFHIIENVLKIKIKHALTGKQKSVRWIDANDAMVLEHYLKTGEKPATILENNPETDEKPEHHESADGEIWLLSYFAKRYNYTNNGLKYQINKAEIKIHRANAGDKVRSVLFLDQEGKERLEEIMDRKTETE